MVWVEMYLHLFLVGLGQAHILSNDAESWMSNRKTIVNLKHETLAVVHTP